MRRTILPVAIAALVLAGCTSNPPLSKDRAAKAFLSAYDAFTTGGKVILKQDQLPNTTGSPEYGRPSSAEDCEAATLIDRYSSRLSSIAWPDSASAAAEAAESALSEEATEVLETAGVSNTNPIVGQDYKNEASAEKRELTAENQLRLALGLPAR